MVGEQELAKLLSGNERFVLGKNASPKDFKTRRSELVLGQKPFATIVCCSDSRVPPEHIFDVGLGEIFIVRVAGNVLDSVCEGSVEYGTTHLNTPLLVVLGHSKCGAVNATCGGGHAEGNIAKIVEKIKPALLKAKEANPALSGSELIEATALENVKGTVELLMKNPELKKLVGANKLKIVGAKYSIETGKVEFVE